MRNFVLCKQRSSISELQRTRVHEQNVIAERTVLQTDKDLINYKYEMWAVSSFTGLLVCPSPDQEGNMLMFPSEWREFPSAPCLAGGKKLDDSSRLDVVEIARRP